MAAQVKDRSSSPTDLAVLWHKAVENYNDKVGNKPNTPKLKADGTGLVRSLDDVYNAVDSSSKAFRKWRHPEGSKLHKVRTIIGENLDKVQWVGDQVVESATAAFPPTGAIWTVVTYAIKACQTMSRDYDQLLGLIGEAGTFIKTLQIIEENVPDCRAYADCVLDALTALMMVFAIQTRFIYEERMLQFWHSLTSGADSELKKAYDDVTAAINRLGSANGFQTVRNTEEIKVLITNYGGKIDDYYETLMTRFERQNQRLEVGFQRQEESFQIQRRVIEVGLKRQQETTLQEFEELRKLLMRQGASDPSQVPAQDLAARRDAAFNKTRQFYGAPPDPTQHFKNLQRTFVSGTDSWLLEDPEFNKWLDGDTPVLLLAGDAGVGKSHLAYSAIKTMQDRAKSQPRTIVAYFFFKNVNEQFTSVRDALCSVGLQIVTQDRTIRETLADTLTDQCCAEWPTAFVWSWTFEEYFKADSGAQLYLILDGIDEAGAEYFDLLAALPDIASDKLRIHVLLTGRPGEAIEDVQADIKPPLIEASLEKARMGLAKIVDARFDSLPRLSNFRPHVKEKISKAILGGNYGPLYVDRFLQNLDSKGLERPAMKAIQPGKMPKDVSSLYDQVLHECCQRRSNVEFDALKLIFAWIASSRRQLNLEEANSLMLLKFGTVVIDLEEEIAEKCASILEMSSETQTRGKKGREQAASTSDASAEVAGLDETQAQAESNSETVADSDTLLSADLLPDCALQLGFQERSLREHICAATAPENGFRKPPFLSHLDMFITIVDVICNVDEAENSKKQAALVILQKYATQNWLKHFCALFEDDEDEVPALASESHLVMVADGLYRIISNPDKVAQLIGQHSDACYDDFDPATVRVWLERALECSEPCLCPEVTAWAKGIVLDPYSFCQPLTRAHVVHWFSQISDDDVREAFGIALKAYQTKMEPSQRIGVIHYNFDAEKAPSDQEKVEEVLSLSNAFPDICKGPMARRAIGVVLMELQSEPSLVAAVDELTESVGDLASTDEEKFFTQITLATLLMEMDEDQDAIELAASALALPWPDSSNAGKEFVQAALELRADWEEKHGMRAEAAGSLDAAMAVSSGRTSSLFNKMIAILDSLGQYEAVLQKVEKWGAARLAMSDDNWADVNRRYQKAAQMTGKESSMIATYEKLVQELEPLGWASPTRYQLALVYRRIIGNIPTAKRVLYDILDADTCIDPMTDLESDSVTYLVRRQLAEIIFQEFYAASTLKEKKTLAQEMEDLPERRLCKNFSSEALESDPESTLRARMYGKLGPRARFQEILDKTFQDCVRSLRDDNPWNDQENLQMLCDVLTCLPGLETEAQIALSAQFYTLDRQLTAKSLRAISKIRPGPEGDYLYSEIDEDEEQGAWEDVDEDDEEINDTAGVLKETEGTEREKYDLSGFRGIPCSGTCIENPDGFTNWDQVLYRCVICSACNWCEKCYQANHGIASKQLENTDTGKRGGGRLCCGIEHPHVKGPVDGWKGIKNGEMHIEGQEPVKFDDFLKELEEIKWPKAWREFWVGVGF